MSNAKFDGENNEHLSSTVHGRLGRPPLDTMMISSLRGSCDNCSRKKTKCSGETPCNRCARANVECNYSTKRKLGRPRTASRQRGGSSKKSRRSATKSSFHRPNFSISPATGLAGLAESRFLSCFIEHFRPMYAITDEVAIRDGLVYVVTGYVNDESVKTLEGQEAMRAQALSCSFFSSIAIGGLTLGYPRTAVERHISAAQRSLDKFRGLSDKFAVSSLLLYAVLNVLLQHGNVNEEYLRYKCQAREVFSSLPEKDPVMTALFAYRDMYEGLLNEPAMAAARSFNPVNAEEASSSGISLVKSSTPEGEAVLRHADDVRSDPGDGSARSQPQRCIVPIESDPTYVVADGLLLTLRFGCESSNSVAAHAHDFLTTEMNRLMEAEVGSLVASSLGCAILILKQRLGLMDLLPTARLIASALEKCPGVSRHHGGHSTHLALAVFRMYGRREEYDASRKLLMQAMPSYIPEYDHCAPQVELCDLRACVKHARGFLEMTGEFDIGQGGIEGFEHVTDAQSHPLDSGSGSELGSVEHDIPLVAGFEASSTSSSSTPSLSRGSRSHEPPPAQRQAGRPHLTAEVSDVVVRSKPMSDTDATAERPDDDLEIDGTLVDSSKAGEAGEPASLPSALAEVPAECMMKLDSVNRDSSPSPPRGANGLGSTSRSGGAARPSSMDVRSPGAESAQRDEREKRNAGRECRGVGSRSGRESPSIVPDALGQTWCPRLTNAAAGEVSSVGGRRAAPSDAASIVWCQSSPTRDSHAGGVVTRGTDFLGRMARNGVCRDGGPVSHGRTLGCPREGRGASTIALRSYSHAARESGGEQCNDRTQPESNRVMPLESQSWSAQHRAGRPVTRNASWADLNAQVVGSSGRASSASSPRDSGCYDVTECDTDISMRYPPLESRNEARPSSWLSGAPSRNYGAGGGLVSNSRHGKVGPPFSAAGLSVAGAGVSELGSPRSTVVPSKDDACAADVWGTSRPVCPKSIAAEAKNPPPAGSYGQELLDVEFTSTIHDGAGDLDLASDLGMLLDVDDLDCGLWSH